MPLEIFVRDLIPKYSVDGIPDNHELVFRCPDEKILDKIESMVLTSFTSCEECRGEVVPSDGMYLCLSGCGHVNGFRDGKVLEKQKELSS